MACLRKRNNKWVVDFSIGPKRKIVSFDTKAEAESFKRELILRPIDHMVGFKPIVEVSVEMAAQEYIERVTAKKAEKTHGVDKLAMSRVTTYFKNQMLYQVSPKEIEMLQFQLAKKLNPATVNRQFNVIKHFFKKCVEWNYLRESPTARLSKLKETAKPKTPLTDEQINSIIEALPGWATDTFYFISKTALRRGQACSLKWETVDLSRKVFVTRSIKGGHEKVYEIPMSAEIHTFFLEKWNARQKSFRKSDYVLLGEDGTQIKPMSLTQAVIRLREKLGIPNAGIHILRHTVITRLGEGNNNGATIQRIAGHSSLVTTQRYLHPNTEEMRRSLEELKDRQQIKRKGRLQISM